MLPIDDQCSLEDLYFQYVPLRESSREREREIFLRGRKRRRTSNELIGHDDLHDHDHHYGNFQNLQMVAFGSCCFHLYLLR